ncbi:MAG: TonB family protein [Lentisphaeria bacterium]|nr:TonB family protein [Lentisphaeria bacterium]
MNDLQQTIPTSRRIQAAFMAMLVTIVVICVFPLLESLTAIHPAPTPQPVAFPVKLATTTTQPSFAPSQQTKPATSPKSMKMAAMTLPKPLPPPPQTPVIQLPPKPLPAPVKTVDIPPQPVVQPNTIIPPAQPINENITQQTETTAIETATTATEDGNRTAEPSLPADSDGALPDGKSLKYPPHFQFTVLPAYPEYARRRGIEGFVILQFTVDINGRVVEPSVHQANPQGYFETAALRAIKQWRFYPGRNDKRTPVSCRLQIRLDFILKDPISHGQQIRFKSIRLQ